MSIEDKLKQKLKRLENWNNRFVRNFEHYLKETEDIYHQYVEKGETEAFNSEEEFKKKKEEIQSNLEHLGKNFAQKKYRLERDGNTSKADMTKMEEEMGLSKSQLESELRRLEEERVKSKVSIERQKSALEDLYQEKRRHLLTSRAKLVRELENAQRNFKETEAQVNEKRDALTSKRNEKISLLKNQMKAKQEGWEMALAALKRRSRSAERRKRRYQETVGDHPRG